MKKGKLHSKDEKRTYLEVHHKSLTTHSNLFPGNKKTKIVPVTHKRYHDSIKQGSNVMFEILPRRNDAWLFLYYGMPLFWMILGFIFANLITKKEFNILAITIIFILFGFYLKSLMRKHCDIFREINVKIHLPKTKIKLYKARKK